MRAIAGNTLRAAPFLVGAVLAADYIEERATREPLVVRGTVECVRGGPVQGVYVVSKNTWPWEGNYTGPASMRVFDDDRSKATFQQRVSTGLPYVVNVGCGERESGNWRNVNTSPAMQGNEHYYRCYDKDPYRVDGECKPGRS